MSSEDFTFRLATPSDVPALVALVNSAYRGETSRAGWSTEADLLGGSRIDDDRLATEMATDGHVVLVHEQDGAIVACVHLQRRGANSYLGMLTTRPTLQAKGVGRRMLEAAEAWAAAHWQSQEMHMTVIVQREVLIAWYERRGYTKTGETRPFPDDERFGVPKRPDLAFHVLKKRLPVSSR